MMSSPSSEKERKHAHYFKNVEHLKTIDVYRVLELFSISDQKLGHAIKKLLVAGGRGHKDVEKDIQEAIDTLQRWQEMRAEDAAKVQAGTAKLFGIDLAHGPDFNGISLIGPAGLGGIEFTQAVPRNQVLPAPWVNLTGHTEKPRELIDNQLVKVKYRSTGEGIKAAGDVSWRDVVAYQVFNLG